MRETQTPSKLEKILAAGHMAVTSECGPPRGSDGEAITKKAEMIKDHVDAINITDNQTSVTRLCSLVWQSLGWVGYTNSPIFRPGDGDVGRSPCASGIPDSLSPRKSEGASG